MAPSWGALDRYSLGAQETPYLKPNQWVASVSYRYFHSFRLFNSSGNEVSIPAIKNDTYVDVWDVSATYGVTKRVSLTLELPFQYGSRTNMAEHDHVHIHTMRASGVGDLRLGATVLLLDPDKHRDQNISLGLGFKAPTGNYSATDYAYRSTGTVLRPVDSAIQPGDGGWGIVLSGNAFAKVYKNTFVYFNGTYVINPRETNGVQPVSGDLPGFNHGYPGLMVNSVPDQFLTRLGLTHAIWPAKGLAVSLGMRWEGVPSHDLIGGSDGWRLPGASVSIEPGISISHGKNFLGVTAPVAVYRYGLNSVPLVHVNNPVTDVASFSNFQINITYSHLF